jgi:hypothetical protein
MGLSFSRSSAYRCADTGKRTAPPLLPGSWHGLYSMTAYRAQQGAFRVRQPYHRSGEWSIARMSAANLPGARITRRSQRHVARQSFAHTSSHRHSCNTVNAPHRLSIARNRGESKPGRPGPATAARSIQFATLADRTSAPLPCNAPDRDMRIGACGSCLSARAR